MEEEGLLVQLYHLEENFLLLRHLEVDYDSLLELHQIKKKKNEILEILTI